MNKEIAKSMLEEFSGCDSDNSGIPEHSAGWLFGIEHGQEFRALINKCHIG